jgi:hypothetical protein
VRSPPPLVSIKAGARSADSAAQATGLLQQRATSGGLVVTNHAGVLYAASASTGAAGQGKAPLRRGRRLQGEGPAANRAA